MSFKNRLFPILLILLSASFFLVAFYKAKGQPFVRFSDAAKFSDIARNIVSGKGYQTNFVFFDPSLKSLPTYAFWIRPLVPISIAAAFLIFGISDFAILATSGFFYLLLILLIYLLGRKLFGELVGILGAIAVAANANFLELATSGASEVLFALEIIFVGYLFVLRRKWSEILGLITLIAMYFTRSQAFIYVAGFTLFWLLLKFNTKKAFTFFIGSVFIMILIDILVLRTFQGQFFLYSILDQGGFAITQHLPGISSSASLRGATISAPLVEIAKKLFYNLYNFYRLLPQIGSPYMWALFILGLFKWEKDGTENSLKISTIFMVAVTFLVTALTIPLFRYLQPVVPLVYLFAVATLVRIIRSMFKPERKVTIASFSLLAFFVLGQTLGIILLDSRFEEKRINKGQPPVYVALSRILKENTTPKSIVVTNLDSWGSWYGERKTVWFPIKPEQLSRSTELPFEAIYLTSYLIDDENYYMGFEWRQILENPKDIENKFVRENYKFVAEFSILAEETYEKQPARAVLLVRK